MSEEIIARDTVIKFCNFSGENSDQNGKYGLVRRRLDDGRYRIMQTSGRDLAVKLENFDVQKIDLNTPVENGVVLVFPPSTGKTGTKPIAIALPDFPHEVSSNGMTPFEWNIDIVDMLLPPELMTPRIIDEKYWLTKKEMKQLKAHLDHMDTYEDPYARKVIEAGLSAENLDFIKDNPEEWKWTHRFVRCRYNNAVRQKWCMKNFGWELPKRLQICENPDYYAAQIPQAVYWHDEAQKTGIENSFMRFVRQPGDDHRGAVVFDLSYKKLRPKDCTKFAGNDIDKLNEFEGVKTLGDFQDYIVRTSVNAGAHPSNPWMDNLLESMMPADFDMNNMNEIMKKMSIIQDENPEEWKRIKKECEKDKENKKQNASASEKKRLLKEKINQKKSERLGK